MASISTTEKNKCTNSTGKAKANFDEHLGVKKEVHAREFPQEEGKTAAFLEKKSTDEDDEKVEFLETEFTDWIWGICC